MTFRPPTDDLLFTLRHVAGLDGLLAEGIAPELAEGLTETVLDAAGTFAAEELAPLDRAGDIAGCVLKDGAVTTPAGFADAYRRWIANGWNGLAASREHGGQGLPRVIQAACSEIWHQGSMAFALGPLLTAGAIDALAAHGSDKLKRLYLPRLVSGEWTGTMNLTEPQAGSDVGALTSQAEPAGDGTYRIRGQKIYITYGEHDWTENIVHLVLARLPDAPPGTRGISLFLVPKFIPDEDGSPGRRNDVFCAGIEHKLGIHAAPTCTMVYGAREGAVGWLVGEENRGLACMFTMMNSARLTVGLEGVAVAERAYRRALAFAQERRQGRAPGASGAAMSPIIDHPDVRRMLSMMLAKTRAARGICYRTAAAIDRAERAGDADAADLAALLTPIAKAWSTDAGIEVSSIGIQVHGGMGFIEETGAAQHLRDARIAAIYEGTNGIQAIDLVTRKLSLRGGDAVAGVIAGLRRVADRAAAANDGELGAAARLLSDAVRALDDATAGLLAAQREGRISDALAGATPYLQLFGDTLGAANLLEEALAGDTGRAALARFFAANVLPGAPGLARTVLSAGDALPSAEALSAA
jgi:butyryl-CoA dehydrogenase